MKASDNYEELKIFRNYLVRVTIDNQKWYGTVIKVQDEKVFIYVSHSKEGFYIFDRKDVKCSYEW